MFNIHEIFILLVSTGVLVLVLFLFEKIVLIPSWKILLSAFVIYYASTVITVVEGFVLPDFLNLIEHLLRTVYPGLMLLWCLSLSRSFPSGGGQS